MALVLALVLHHAEEFAVVIQARSTLPFLDVSLGQQGEHAVISLQQDGEAPANAVAVGILRHRAERPLRLHFIRRLQGIEALGSVGPLHHPALHALGYDVGSLLLDRRLVAVGQSVVVEPHGHLPYPILVSLVRAMQPLARQHAVVGLQALCLDALQGQGSLRRSNIDDMLLTIVQDEASVPLFQRNPAVGRNKPLGTCRKTQQAGNR